MPESKSKRSRYTPPPQKKAPPSKLWVPVGLTTLLGVGLAVVVTNYLNLLPGPDTVVASNHNVLCGQIAAQLDDRPHVYCPSPRRTA